MEDRDKAAVLLVDDEPDILDFLERVLRRRYAVTRCASAEEAVGHLSVGAFDILITDQKMPRVSGLELLAEAARRRPAMVRLLISGYTEVPEMEQAIEDGRLHNYILKPVDSQKVLEAVEEAYRVRDEARRLPLS